MAEIDEHVYGLIRDAITTCSTGIAAVNTTLTELRITLNEKFLTKQEDVTNDEERNAAIYKYVDKQFNAVYWALGLLITISLIVDGFLLTKALNGL